MWGSEVGQKMQEDARRWRAGHRQSELLSNICVSDFVCFLLHTRHTVLTKLPLAVKSVRTQTKFCDETSSESAPTSRTCEVVGGNETDDVYHDATSADGNICWSDFL